MRNLLNKIFPDRHPLRLAFHKMKAVVAAIIYGFPANRLKVIGVTGTNGKTTTVNLIAHLLEEAGYKVGLASTVNFKVGESEWVNNTKQSSQSPFALQKLLRQMVRYGCEFAVLEVTSHAVDQHRIWGVNFDTAVYTNLSNDHLEYHGSFEAYKAAKARLFELVSRGRRKPGVKKSLVVNADDQYGEYFNQFPADLKISYGLKNATVFADNVAMQPEGTRMMVHLPNRQLEVLFRLPGEYNVYNSLAAVAVALAWNVDLEAVKRGLENFKGVAGRYEDVNFGQEFSIVVDYAHNADSLESLLQLYRALTPRRLHLVFGATGGGRDKGKRPLMGALADQYVDDIYLTDDDPYEEDEMEIIEMVAAGIKRKEGNGFWMIPDRREAIRLALSKAQKGDTVIVAGKGAEQVMIVRGKRIEWNDKAVIKALLEREVKVEIGEEEWLGEAGNR